MARLDYDDIAHVYDEPLRDHEVDRNLLTFLGEGGERWSRLRVLDVGCGTGKQLAANHGRWPQARLVGVDRSCGMLRIAHRRCPSATWVQGDGARLPFAAGTFQYATSQFSYPHVGRTPELLEEVCRVLTPGGRFVMTNIDPWSMADWLVYRYFPDARDLDHRDYMPVERFTALMTDAGFHDVRVQRRDASIDQDLRDFLRYASSRYRASQFMAIPDAAYEAGLRRVEQDIAAAPEPTLVRSAFVLVKIVGDKPG